MGTAWCAMKKGNYSTISFEILSFINRPDSYTYTENHRVRLPQAGVPLELIGMLNLLSLFCFIVKQICQMPLSGAEYLHCVCMCLHVTAQEEQTMTQTWIWAGHHAGFANPWVHLRLPSLYILFLSVRVKKKGINIFPVCYREKPVCCYWGQ